jgi:hypothetical protein
MNETNRGTPVHAIRKRWATLSWLHPLLAGVLAACTAQHRALEASGTAPASAARDPGSSAIEAGAQSAMLDAAAADSGHTDASSMAWAASRAGSDGAAGAPVAHSRQPAMNAATGGNDAADSGAEQPSLAAGANAGSAGAAGNTAWLGGGQPVPCIGAADCRKTLFQPVCNPTTATCDVCPDPEQEKALALRVDACILQASPRCLDDEDCRYSGCITSCDAH